MAPNKNWIQVVIWSFVVLMLLTSYLTGKTVDSDGLKWVSSIATVITFAVLIFDRWLWRAPIIRWIVIRLGVPIVHGTWKGKLNYDADADGKSGSVDFYLRIKQTFSSVTLCGFVSTSESYALAASIEKTKTATPQLVYMYRSEAPHGKRTNNRPHDGASVLKLIGAPVRSIEGSYFTERPGGSGQIVLTRKSGKLAQTFDDAKALTYKVL